MSTLASPKVCVAHLGARRYYALPRVIHEAGMLERFYTDIFVGNKSLARAPLRRVANATKIHALQRWLNRDHEQLPNARVTSYDLFGLQSTLRRRFLGSTSDRYARINAEFNRRILRSGLPDCDVVWGWNSASLELFRHAKQLGKLCVLDQNLPPNAIVAALLREEQARWPGWQPSLAASDKSALIARQSQEWELADCIVAPSDFVRAGLLEVGVDSNKLRIVPYPVDLQRFHPPAAKARLDNRPLRILFAGEVGLRKGVPYLLDAVARLGKQRVQVRLAGPVRIARDKLEPYRDVAEFLGALPNKALPELYHWADVFVFPTLCDAFALAHAEALASGVPVITTPNCGSIVREGLDGHIVPIRDADAIQHALERYLDQPELLQTQSQAALDVRDRLSIRQYGLAVVSLICELTAKRPLDEARLS